MITSNMTRAGHGSRIVVPAGGELSKRCGLLMDSVIMTDNLATIRHSEIDRIIGNVELMDNVEAALRVTLGL